MCDRVVSRSGMLRQQMISQSESKGERKMSNREHESRSARDIIGEADDQTVQKGNVVGENEASEPEANIEDVQDMGDEDMGEEPIASDEEEELQDEQDDTPEQDEAVEESELAPTFGELLAGSGAVRLRIEPRIMLNVTPSLADGVPEVVEINGSHYSVASPMRKGNGSERNPYGLLRSGLADLASFVGHSRDEAMLFGPADGIEDRVNELMSYLDGRARELMYGVFDDPHRPKFSFVSAPEEEEEADEDEDENIDDIGVTENNVSGPTTHVVTVPAEQSFSVVTWPVYDTDSEDGTVILRPTVSVNVNMPILANAQSMLKPLSSMQKIVNNYAREAGLGDDDFRLSLAFNTEDILDESLLNVFQSFTTEDSEAVIVSGTYLRKCATDLGHDLYRLFPAGNTAHDAERMLLTNGGDALLLL